jgi:DNA-binding IclR family transcriptional regulator
MLLGSEIALLLEILGDGKWHGLAELQRQAGLAEYKVHGIAEFLCRFDFAVVDEAYRKVKVKRDFQEFLMRT